MNSEKKGLLFVVSAPAGTGKTTLVRMLLEEFNRIVGSISFTTREPRTNETPGKDYFFLTKKEFEEKIEQGEFLEYATVFGEYYGTSQTFIDSQLKKGKSVVLVIDTQGAMQIMGKVGATFIFISPPSLEELRVRLYRRESESAEKIELRLSWAEKEMVHASQYDYHIINDQLKVAYDALRSIFIAEEHRNR